MNIGALTVRWRRRRPDGTRQLSWLETLAGTDPLPEGARAMIAKAARAATKDYLDELAEMNGQAYTPEGRALLAQIMDMLGEYGKEAKAEADIQAEIDKHWREQRNTSGIRTLRELARSPLNQRDQDYRGSSWIDRLNGDAQ